MTPDHLIEQAVAEYRTYWNAIRNIECSDFSGEWRDVQNLDYAVYEGFGPASNSDDYFLETAVFTNFLVKKANFRAVEANRERTIVVLEPLEPFSGFSVNIMARVQDAMRRSSPQFEKMNELFIQLMMELLMGDNTQEEYAKLVLSMQLDGAIKERCAVLLNALAQTR